MPVDYERLAAIENVKANRDVSLESLGKMRDQQARELEAWKRVQAMMEHPGWKDVRGLFESVRDGIMEVQASSKHLNTTRLIELRGRLQVLADILTLDKQAAVGIESASRAIIAYEKQIQSGQEAEETVMKGGSWLPAWLRKI